MISNFWEAVKGRRTFYQISDEAVTSDERVLELVRDAVRHAPTSFNSQSGRVVILLGENHERLWDITNLIITSICVLAKVHLAPGAWQTRS